MFEELSRSGQGIDFLNNGRKAGNERFINDSVPGKDFPGCEKQEYGQVAKQKVFQPSQKFFELDPHFFHPLYQYQSQVFIRCCLPPGNDAVFQPFQRIIDDKANDGNG